MKDDTIHSSPSPNKHEDESAHVTHLTKIQKKLLEEIEVSLHEHGYAPSYRELMVKFGYKSLGAIHRLIRELQKKGHLTRPLKRSWRSISLVKESAVGEERKPEESLSNPLKEQRFEKTVGTCAVEVIGTISGNKAPELFLHPKSFQIPPIPQIEKSGHTLLYGLLIQDTSFTSEHLLPGDIIVVEPTEEILPGELVLATTETESIIGHFFDEGDVVRFKSSPYSHTSSFFQSKKAASSHTQIWGIIVASIRGFASLFDTN